MSKEDFPNLDQNLDQKNDQEVKTYAEMSKEERQEFKEQKERDLEVLKDSFVEYGIPARRREIETEIETEEEEFEGVEFSIIEEDEKLKLAIEQKYGKGIWGLGKSDSSVWMCPDHKDLKSFEENRGFDANTNMDFEKAYQKGHQKGYQGIIFEDIGENEKGETRMKIRITADHPVMTFANFLGKNKEVYLPGKFNNWDAPDPLKFNEEGELEGEIVWNKNKRAQCKIAIRIKSEFDNGGWKDGAKQIMKINLEEENKEE